MAAAFGEGLVFQLNHGRTRALKTLHRAHDVKRIAKSGVGIDDDRQAHALGDAGKGVSHFGVGGQAYVGAAQPGVGNGCSGQVQSLKARLLRNQRA